MDDETKAFLPGDPLTLFQAGTFNRVPVVTGIMEEEGLLFHSACKENYQKPKLYLSESV